MQIEKLNVLLSFHTSISRLFYLMSVLLNVNYRASCQLLLFTAELRKRLVCKYKSRQNYTSYLHSSVRVMHQKLPNRWFVKVKFSCTLDYKKS